MDEQVGVGAIWQDTQERAWKRSCAQGKVPPGSPLVIPLRVWAGWQEEHGAAAYEELYSFLAALSRVEEVTQRAPQFADHLRAAAECLLPLWREKEREEARERREDVQARKGQEREAFKRACVALTKLPPLQPLTLAELVPPGVRVGGLEEQRLPGGLMVDVKQVPLRVGPVKEWLAKASYEAFMRK